MARKALTGLEDCCCENGPCCPEEPTITDCETHGCDALKSGEPVGGPHEDPCTGPFAFDCAGILPFNSYFECPGCTGMLPLALYRCTGVDFCEDNDPSEGLSTCYYNFAFCGCVP